jgi:hypothetical protein
MLGNVLVPTIPAPTRGTRRELGSEINENEDLINIYRQTPRKSPHEVSRIRRVAWHYGSVLHE